MSSTLFPTTRLVSHARHAVLCAVFFSVQELHSQVAFAVLGPKNDDRVTCDPRPRSLTSSGDTKSRPSSTRARGLCMSVSASGRLRGGASGVDGTLGDPPVAVGRCAISMASAEQVSVQGRNQAGAPEAGGFFAPGRETGFLAASFGDVRGRHRQVGSLAGAAHLLNDNAGVLRICCHHCVLTRKARGGAGRCQWPARRLAARAAR